MASNQRLLKAYLRYDDSGRISPGSLILRGNMPKGRGWVEVPAYECCNPSVTLTRTITSGGGPGEVCVEGFQIACGEDVVLQSNFSYGVTLTTIITNLNSTYGFLGVWTAPNSGTIQLDLKLDIANNLCPTGELELFILCGG